MNDFAEWLSLENAPIRLSGKVGSFRLAQKIDTIKPYQGTSDRLDLCLRRLRDFGPVPEPKNDANSPFQDETKLEKQAS